MELLHQIVGFRLNLVQNTRMSTQEKCMNQQSQEGLFDKMFCPISHFRLKPLRFALKNYYCLHHSHKNIKTETKNIKNKHFTLDLKYFLLSMADLKTDQTLTPKHRETFEDQLTLS